MDQQVETSTAEPIQDPQLPLEGAAQVETPPEGPKAEPEKAPEAPATPAGDTQTPPEAKKKRTQPAGAKGNGHSEGLDIAKLNDFIFLAVNQAVEGALKPEAPKDTKSVPLIFGSMRRIMEDILPLAKTHIHPDKDFTFRTIDEFAAVLEPLFHKHAIMWTPEVLSVSRRKELVRLPTSEFWQFYTDVLVRWHVISLLDGSEWPVPITTAGEGMSDVHYSTAAAQTFAYKQALWMTYMIPTYGAEDPEGTVGYRAQPFSGGDTGSVPSSSQSDLFAEGDDDEFSNGERVAETSALQGRGGRRTAQPQVIGAAGATVEIRPPVAQVAAALDTPLPPAKKTPLTGGFKNIIKIGLEKASKTEEEMFTEMKVSGWEELTSDLVPDIMGWIQKQ